MAGVAWQRFKTAFAHGEGKHNQITGNDFMFLHDVIGGEEIRPINLFCYVHAHLMRLMSADVNHGVVMDHDDASLQQLRVNGDFNQQFWR